MTKATLRWGTGAETGADVPNEILILRLVDAGGAFHDFTSTGEVDAAGSVIFVEQNTRDGHADGIHPPPASGPLRNFCTGDQIPEPDPADPSVSP